MKKSFGIFVALAALIVAVSGSVIVSRVIVPESVLSLLSDTSFVADVC